MAEEEAARKAAEEAATAAEAAEEVAAKESASQHGAGTQEIDTPEVVSEPAPPTPKAKTRKGSASKSFSRVSKANQPREAAEPVAALARQAENFVQLDSTELEEEAASQPPSQPQWPRPTLAEPVQRPRSPELQESALEHGDEVCDALGLDESNGDMVAETAIVIAGGGDHTKSAAKPAECTSAAVAKPAASKPSTRKKVDSDASRMPPPSAVPCAARPSALKSVPRFSGSTRTAESVKKSHATPHHAPAEEQPSEPRPKKLRFSSGAEDAALNEMWARLRRLDASQQQQSGGADAVCAKPALRSDDSQTALTPAAKATLSRRKPKAAPPAACSTPASKPPPVTKAASAGREAKRPTADAPLGEPASTRRRVVAPSGGSNSGLMIDTEDRRQLQALRRGLEQLVAREQAQKDGVVRRLRLHATQEVQRIQTDTIEQISASSGASSSITSDSSSAASSALEGLSKLRAIGSELQASTGTLRAVRADAKRVLSRELQELHRMTTESGSAAAARGARAVATLEDARAALDAANRQRRQRKKALSQDLQRQIMMMTATFGLSGNASDASDDLSGAA